MREKILEAVTQAMPSNRVVHTLGVEETAISLSKNFALNLEDVQAAALLHDIVKFEDKNWLKQQILDNYLPTDLLEFHVELWHSHVGAVVAKEQFGITDETVLNAIRFHTTGRDGMSALEKVIYVADLLEPNRQFPGVDFLREQVNKDFHKGFEECVVHSLSYLIKKRVPIYPDSLACYNDVVKGRKREE
ncbi:bis(5'-nucleosyl)-tetraphosphatase (symmetrical) YqeK [Paenisporosarcina cavernae]|uniref:bis(5'-nucleosyl)-tetraphosphatase (symmetrical) YqeK n=1 Tax=Paenisporosarcina cavernae TaxID=2320858 RepID=UPI001EE4F91F|nr:bis(5'-nucleosyl)-tetraphosphatase (symmetrical) YqeK [Paenisporosarcina cavernae]